MTRWIFKILRPDERHTAEGNSNYHGSPADVQDGFIHFSTSDQLQGTIEKHFSDTDHLHILVFDAHGWQTDLLKWEKSRGNMLFPHLYRSLDISLAASEWILERDQKGAFNLVAPLGWGTDHA